MTAGTTEFERAGLPFRRAALSWRRRPDVLFSLVARPRGTDNREVVYVPGWLRFPAWLHGVAPVAYRRLANWYS